MEILKKIFLSKLNKLTIQTKRYLFDKIDLKDRLIGLVGCRGTGKTTMMLQIMKEKIKKNCIYLLMDHIYFLENSLYQTVIDLYERNDIRYFFLDEVHKYKDWQQEIKNIYDSYDDIHIVFSGSSSINLIKGGYDLSRRCVIYKLYGLSFREFLHIKYSKTYKEYTFEEIISNYKEINYEIIENEKLLLDFEEYYKYGYYPIYFENPYSIRKKIINLYEKIIYEDIVDVCKVNTDNVYYLKKLILFIATMQPGEININSLSNIIKRDNKTVQKFINILDECGLINSFYSEGSGGVIAKSPEKIYIENSTLYNCINEEIGREINKGAIREIIFSNFIRNSGHNINYSKKIGDFLINNLYFEIGGKGKSKRQIAKNIEKSFIVKDDILFAEEGVIPLYLFGFIY